MPRLAALDPAFALVPNEPLMWAALKAPADQGVKSALGGPRNLANRLKPSSIIGSA